MKYLFLLFSMLCYAHLNAQEQSMGDPQTRFNEVMDVLHEYYSWKPGYDDAANYTTMKSFADRTLPKLSYILSSSSSDYNLQNKARCVQLKITAEYLLRCHLYGNSYSKPLIADAVKLYENFTVSLPIQFEYSGYTYTFDQSFKNYCAVNIYLVDADCYLSRSNFEKCIEQAQKASAIANEAYSKTLSNLMITFSKGSLLSNDKEALDAEVIVMQNYKAVEDSSKILWKSGGFYTPLHSYTNIYEILLAQPALSQKGYYYAQAVPFLKENELPLEALDFYDRAVKDGYSDVDFLLDAADFAIPYKENELALQACDKASILVAVNDCDRMQRLAGLYILLNKPDLAKAMKEKADECFKDRAKAEAKAEKERQRNAGRRYQGGARGGIYLGIDVIPLLALKNDRRDYGFQVDLMGRHNAHEFFYKKVNNERDFLIDVSDEEDTTSAYFGTYDGRWNGYQVHYAWKHYLNDLGDGAVFYLGPCVRYRNKTFDAVTSNIWDNDVLFVRSVTTIPTEQQYELMLNYGMMATRPGIAGQFYIGYGVKYSRFQGNFEEWNSDQFYVDNNLLEFRKADRFGLAFRMGFTLGIKIG